MLHAQPRDPVRAEVPQITVLSNNHLLLLNSRQ